MRAWVQMAVFAGLVVVSGCRSVNGGPDSGEVELRVGSCTALFDSLERAVEASRRFGADSGKTLLLSGGQYFLDQPLLLDGRDDGLTVQAKPGEAPVLFGGRLIQGWRRDEDGFLVADVPEVFSKDWNFRSLMVNGRCAERARWPESGRLQHQNSFKVRWLSTAEGGWEREPTMDELTRMNFEPGDLGDWFEPKNAEVTVYHYWDETLVGVESIDMENHELRFSEPTGHPIGSFGVRDYVVWNVRKGMTRPGQWYLDRVKGQLIYCPFPGEDAASIQAVAPVLEHVVRLEDAKNIILRGLTFCSANTQRMKGDYGAKLFDGAVSARNTDDCVFEDLTVYGVSGWGMKLFGDRLVVKNCHLHDLGAGGVRLIGSDAVIENNHIHHGGLVYPSAILLYVGCTDPNMVDEWQFGKDESGVVIRHNELHDGPYVGIGIGGSRHEVAYNKVYRVMQELCDGAALYATFCSELKLRNNLVRDLKDDPKIHGYYLDELSDNALVESNISINVSGPSHNHMASGNVYRNNIFVSSRAMSITTPRCRNMTFENNVFVSPDRVQFTVAEGEVSLVENVFGTPVVEQRIISESYKKGAFAKLALPDGNRQESAGLVIEGDDISFTEGAAPVDLGIQPLAGSEAGVTVVR